MTRINNSSNIIRVLNYLTNGFSVQFINNQAENIPEITNNLDINKELIAIVTTLVELIKIRLQKYPVDNLIKDKLITKKSDTEILEEFLRINKPITNK